MRNTILKGFLCCLTASSLSSSSVKNRKITDLKSLSPVEKLGLLAFSALQPEKHGNITWNSLFEVTEHPLVDVYFSDVRTLLTQLVKLETNAPFPEVSYTEVGDICLPFCQTFRLILETGSTSITGQKRTTSTNEITPTTFKNSFHAPSFIWASPGFLFEIDDIDDSVRYIYRNMRIALNGLKWETAFDYDFVPELGIQISNLDIKFSVNWLRINIFVVGTISGDGWFIPLLPIFTDWTANLRSAWTDLKDDFISLMEHRINCVLSDYRVDPEGCRNGTRTMTEKYHRLNVVQLFETIGLGALDRSE